MHSTIDELFRSHRISNYQLEMFNSFVFFCVCVVFFLLILNWDDATRHWTEPNNVETCWIVNLKTRELFDLSLGPLMGNIFHVPHGPREIVNLMGRGILFLSHFFNFFLLLNGKLKGYISLTKQAINDSILANGKLCCIRHFTGQWFGPQCAFLPNVRFAHNPPYLTLVDSSCHFKCYSKWKNMKER